MTCALDAIIADELSALERAVEPSEPRSQITREGVGEETSTLAVSTSHDQSEPESATVDSRTTSFGSKTTCCGSKLEKSNSSMSI